VYYQRGDYEEAVAQLERAVTLAGDDATIAEHLGDAYRQLGRSAEALRVYRDALSRSKEDEQAERIRSKIEELQASRTRGGEF
jgi:Flp pilus assembly protein TadD